MVSVLIISAAVPDAKGDNKAGSKKTTGRAQQPQQAQSQPGAQQRQQRREGNGAFSGFPGFGR